MFGALNRFISQLDAGTTSQATNQGPVDNSFGFQVLRNTNADLPIEPWFDFIIGINGHMIDNPDPSLFATEVQNCAGSSLSLDLWSAKGQRTHALTIPVPTTPQSLGLSLQLSPLNSTQNIWHILTIPSPLSPAHLAGLLPHSDYILGTPSGTLRGESALGELVEDHLNRSLILWVYNSEFDVVREVELVPRRGWGGDGALGAVLGFGALHRLPIGLGEEIQAPGEKLFDAGKTSSDNYSSNNNNNNAMDGGKFVVPAEMNAPIQQLPPPPPLLSPNAPPPLHMRPAPVSKHSKKGRHHAAPMSPNSGFEDMFNEFAAKSKEEDYVPSRKGTPLPPPPKIGEPVVPGPPPRSPSPEKDTPEEVGEPGEAEES